MVRLASVDDDDDPFANVAAGIADAVERAKVGNAAEHWVVGEYSTQVELL